MADRSEFGWSTVSEYLSDKLASNSEDEKRIFRSERRAERRSKQAGLSVFDCRFVFVFTFALDFACTVQHLPAVNRIARVWHAFATVTGRHSCVSCCTLTSFERGLSCILRFGT